MASVHPFDLAFFKQYLDNTNSSFNVLVKVRKRFNNTQLTNFIAVKSFKGYWISGMFLRKELVWKPSSKTNMVDYAGHFGSTNWVCSGGLLTEYDFDSNRNHDDYPLKGEIQTPWVNGVNYAYSVHLGIPLLQPGTVNWKTDHSFTAEGNYGGMKYSGVLEVFDHRVDAVDLYDDQRILRLRIVYHPSGTEGLFPPKYTIWSVRKETKDLVLPVFVRNLVFDSGPSFELSEFDPKRFVEGKGTIAKTFVRFIDDRPYLLQHDGSMKRLLLPGDSELLGPKDGASRYGIYFVVILGLVGMTTVGWLIQKPSIGSMKR